MRYQVKHQIEEFECPYCGCPVQYGEWAWQEGPDMYCSQCCAVYAKSESFADWIAREDVSQ